MLSCVGAIQSGFLGDLVPLAASSAWAHQREVYTSQSLLLQSVFFLMSLCCLGGQWTLLSLLYTLAPSPPGRCQGREML